MFLKNSAVFLSLLLSLGLIYSPALVGYYAHHDDYFAWQWNKKEGAVYPQFSPLFYSGRFLGALLQWGYFASVEMVLDLNKLRMISLVYVSLCAFICFLLLRKILRRELDAFLFSIMMFTLPGFQITVAWASSVLVATAVSIAALSACIVGKFLMNRSLRQLMTNSYSYLSIGLLIASIMMYQPAGMFFWVVAVLITLNCAQKSFEEGRASLFLFFKIGIASMMLYMLILWSLKPFLQQGSRVPGAYDPFDTIDNLFNKLKWFVKEPLVNVLNFWSIFPTVKATFVAVGILIGSYSFFIFKCFRCCETSVLEKLRRIGWVLLVPTALIFLSYLPNMATEYITHWYQCSVALGPMVLIGFLVIVQYWMLFFPPKIKRPLLTALLIVSCLWGASLANANITKYCLIPDHWELEYLKTRFRQAELIKYKMIVIVLAEQNLFYPEGRYHEFGSPSSSIDYHAMGIIRCALKEIGIPSFMANNYSLDIRCEMFYPNFGKTHEHYYFIKCYSKGETFDVDKETLVIDMNLIKSWAQHQLSLK